MTKQSIFFGGKVSQNYEDYLGSFLFEPFAVDLAGRIDWAGVGAVLELACGSGRLTRHISEQLPSTAVFTATDLSEDMIGVAQSMVPGDRVNWAMADMQDLPFESGSFDLVVCQFGIMLVPDQEKAMAEIFRVLRTGGRVLFNTWTDRDHNRIWKVGNDVIKPIVGKSLIEQNPGPFALEDELVVKDMLKRAGFTVIKSTIVTKTGEGESAEKAAFGFIYGLPIGGFVEKEKAGALPVVLQKLEERLTAEFGEGAFSLPQKAMVVEAIK